MMRGVGIKSGVGIERRIGRGVSAEINRYILAESKQIRTILVGIRSSVATKA